MHSEKIISRIRTEIAEIQVQLQQLNIIYPSERMKPFADRDPEYHAKRSALLNRSQYLASQQNSIRIRRKILSQ